MITRDPNDGEPWDDDTTYVDRTTGTVMRSRLADPPRSAASCWEKAKARLAEWAKGQVPK